MDTWPYAVMPAWFLESFQMYSNIASLTDPESAARKFWLEILTHEQWPSPDQPSLVGRDGGGFK